MINNIGLGIEPDTLFGFRMWIFGKHYPEKNIVNTNRIFRVRNDSTHERLYELEMINGVFTDTIDPKNDSVVWESGSVFYESHLIDNNVGDSTPLVIETTFPKSLLP